jgi:predicted enzyme related to lactoylglutathione lyase
MGVTGIGGLFFRARDPDALRQWYLDNLEVGGKGYDPWAQAAGPTMFMPFAGNTDYWPEEKQWMLNLRVGDLDTLIARLRKVDIEVQTDPAWDTPETGRFARIQDPEGNRIELWEPPAE